MAGLLVLNGGEEFQAGNEPQDELLVEAAGDGPAFVLPTAAARGKPDQAVANARRWFARLGLHLRELPILTRRDATEGRWVVEAAQGSLFYLVGGDPGLVVKTLSGTPVWEAVAGAWRRGAALAGSSAGAMALGQWTLVMARWPQHDVRRAVPALNVVPGVAVLPHYERFGRRWTESEIAGLPGEAALLGLDEKTAAVWDGTSWTALGAGGVTMGGATARAGGVIAALPRPASE